MSQYIFKNTGKNINDIKKRLRRQEVIESERFQPIGIVLPLRNSQRPQETLFSMTYDENEQIKINLKNLILTKKGEYLGRPDFGTDLIELYNSSNKENVDELAMQEVKSAVGIFMPFVELQDYTSSLVSATETSLPYIEIAIKYLFNDIKNVIYLKLQFSR